MRILLLFITLFLPIGCNEYIDSNKEALKKTHDLKDQINQKISGLEEDSEESEDDELAEEGE